MDRSGKDSCHDPLRGGDVDGKFLSVWTKTPDHMSGSSSAFFMQAPKLEEPAQYLDSKGAS